ncbi:MAG: ArsA family ATPase [Actinomycetota bacterium]
MDIRHFLTASRALIVAGKGGVGKSVVSKALATVATGAGLSVLHVEIDGKDATALPDSSVDRLTLSAGTALGEYLQGRGLGILTRQLDRLGIVDLVASTAPGIDDLLVLGKIKQLVRDDPHDVIIIDGPAAGHAVDLLRSPRTLKRTVRGGPIAQQADDVLAMFADATRLRVMLVTRPAMTPVSELVETERVITGTLGVNLSPVVVNGLHAGVPSGISAAAGSELARAVAYVEERRAAELEALAALATAVDTPQLHTGHHVASGADLVSLVAGDLRDAIGDLA